MLVRVLEVGSGTEEVIGLQVAVTQAEDILPRHPDLADGAAHAVLIAVALDIALDRALVGEHEHAPGCLLGRRLRRPRNHAACRKGQGGAECQPNHGLHSGAGLYAEAWGWSRSILHYFSGFTVRSSTMS